jgi:hypothetical protein
VADNGASPLTWYADQDGDGWGSELETVESCTRPEGYLPDAGDCDDGNPNANPDAAEVCDEADNDCDESIDEDPVDGTTWYADDDRDGYGDESDTEDACDAPLGYTGSAGDCDDTTAAISPDATEVCDGVDDDCDGTIDDSEAWGTFYADDDGDGYGDPSDTSLGCDAPAGYVVDGTDCDDTDADVHPTASDAWYDGVDANCDGLSDYDRDGDGYDSDAYGGTDCDDYDAAFNPGVAETWYDGLDENCDGLSDYDQDGDGYDADGYGGDDCDDADDTVYPWMARARRTRTAARSATSGPWQAPRPPRARTPPSPWTGVARQTATATA